MAIFDVILIVILGGFVLFGLWFGFIHTFGSLVGVFGGAFVASRLFEPLGQWLITIFGHSNIMKLAAFFLIFMLVNRLIGFGFHLLDKIFKFVSIVPFLKSINRLLGACLGFLEGILVIGLTLYVAVRLPMNDWFTQQLKDSEFLPWFIKTSAILKPMIPEALKNLKDIIL